MFSKAILVSALAALASAQSAVLTFTHVPNPVTDGQAQAITYATNDTTSPVTITLRKGVSTDLQTVAILTSSSTGGQYIWTPEDTLPNGSDYALQISQGNQVNYFGPFAVQGASASATISSYVSASVTSSTSITLSNNLTITTAVVPIGTAPVAPGSSMGTGTALPRNTTMSMATLSGSGSATSMAGSSASATGSSGSSAGSSGSGAGFQGGSASATSSGAAATSSSGASRDLTVGGLLALAFGAVAAAF